MFIANYTYQDVKKYYDESVQESVYCRGVRYAHEAGKKKVILKICDLHIRKWSRTAGSTVCQQFGFQFDEVDWY